MPDADPLPPLSTPRLDAIREPIPGDSPAGIDMAYEDTFLNLKAEVDAMGAATGDVDFGSIVDLASQILSNQSKDVSVACYLAFGLSRTNGFAGVAEGVGAVRAVVEGFWETAFPPLRRMRARQAAMQFMAERLNAWSETETAKPSDREDIEQALAEAMALQEFTAEAMGDEAPAFSNMTRTFREALRKLPAPKPPEPDPLPEEEASGESTTEAGSAGAAPQAASPASRPSGGDAAFSTVREADMVIFGVARFLREQDPFDMTAVLLVRAVGWGRIVAPPVSGMIPPPPEDRKNMLSTMLAASNFADLFQAGEDLLQEDPFHFWLDLQRIVAKALAALGAPAAAAHAAVVDSTAALVRRLPALPMVTFNDGSPFADGLTVAWLDEIAAAQGGGGGGGASAGSDASRDAIREAQEKAGGGDVPGAVATLMAGAGAPRDRFERGVAAAEMCLGSSRPDVALALLEDADDVIQRHRLDVWDPASARTALRLLHASCTALLATADVPERHNALSARAADAFARLARIDPGLAMRTVVAATEP